MSVTPIDIRMDVAFLRNLKTRKLIAALGSDGVVSLIRLWCYTRERHPQGVLEGVGLDDLELIAGWTGERGAFTSYTTTKRWVDVSPEGVLSVHDWPDHQPWAFGSERRSNAAKIGATSKWQRVKKKGDSARRIRGASEPHTKRIAVELSPGGENGKTGVDGGNGEAPATPQKHEGLCEAHTNRNAPSPSPSPSPNKDLPPTAGATAGGFEAPAEAPKATRLKDACSFIGGCQNRGTVKHSNGQWYCRNHDPDLPPPPPGNGAGKGENRTPLPPSIRALNLTPEKSASVAPIFLRHLSHPIHCDDLATELLGAGLDSNEVFRTAQAFFGSPGKR
jgi:hypothetical protein